VLVEGVTIKKEENGESIFRETGKSREERKECNCDKLGLEIQNLQLQLEVGNMSIEMERKRDYNELDGSGGFD
jgi:hypothetical protein